MIRRCLRVGILMALGLWLAACNRKPSGADAVKAFEGLADAICACKDMDCASKAGESAAKELEKYKDAKLDEKQKKSASQAGERTRECMSKLAPAVVPPPAPAPAPEPAPAPTPAPPTPAPATP